LQRHTLHDGLTGLPNRALLADRLAHALTSADRTGRPVAVLVLDLDGFKVVNDAAGHAVGDQVLATVAAALRRAVAPGDVVSRFGGEEFMLLISRYDKATLVKDARALITRIDEALAPFAREHGLTLGASAGLTLARPECQAPALLAEVSHALREAKANGRHQLSTHETFVDGGGPPDPEAELERFRNVTRHYADRLTDMVTDMGRRLVEGARRQALEDPLTGVHNRRYFDERIAREVDRARKHERALAVVLIDVDHFHAVNATYGWPTGDEVLKRIAGTAAGCVRLVDWVARYGGEEFVVVMPETSLDEAAAVAERIRAQVRALVPKSIDGRTLEVSVSAGVAAFDPAAMDGPVALLERACDALRRAKDEGRDRVLRAG
ncbi:MAG: GGDEF domain-containing protein, partial [Rubrivivax sp.]